MRTRRALGRVVVAGLVLAAAAGALGVVGTGAWWSLSRDPPIQIVVERGDTLFELARDHGVTVDELRAWNGLQGDLIEVGQVLLVYASPPPAEVDPATAGAPVPRSGTRRGGAPSPPTRPSLTMPPERSCLAGPSLEGGGDAEMAASAGLAAAQVRAAMDGFVHHTLRCLEGTGASPSEALSMQIRVACTGRVADVAILDAGDWDGAIAACVTDTIRYTPFPAHDLPDGEVFEYPLRYSAE